MEGNAQKVRGQNLLDRLYFLRGSQQPGTPLFKDGSDLVGILFSDEIVKPGPSLEQRGIERPLSTIVRMQMELGTGCRWRIKSVG